MKSLSLLSIALASSSITAFTINQPLKTSTQLSESKADLVTLAGKCNPVLKYFDPLNLAGTGLYGFDESQTIGWLRHAEIKHGRVAMAAFVGYCVQSNTHFPWRMTLDGASFPSTDLSPPEQWDALPFASKLQIILFVGILEIYSELVPIDGTTSFQPHYTQGGQPGRYPPFDDIPHPVPFNLYDPFKLSTNMSEERKAFRLVAEINNGRLAMLGIFGFLCAQTIPGSVPVLTNIVKPYAGQVMAPFEGNDAIINIY